MLGVGTSVLGVLGLIVVGGATLSAAEWKETALLAQAGFQHSGTLDDILALPDGDRVLTSCRDGGVRLWDLQSGKLLRSYVSKDGGDVWGLLLLPGSKEFMSAEDNGVVVRWDLATGKELMSYKHGGTAYRLALHPDGNRFVATYSKKRAIMWDLKTGEEIRRFEGHEGSVYTVAFLAGGEEFVTGGSDGRLKLWNTESGNCERTLKKNFEDLYTIVVSEDGERLAACSEDKFIRVYEAGELGLLWEKELPAEVNVVTWSPKGKLVAGACDDGCLYLLDAGNGDEVRKIEVPNGDHVPVAFTSDGNELLSGGDRLLFRWNAGTGKRIEPTMGYPVHGTSSKHVTVTSDGARVAVGGEGEELLLWDVASETLASRLNLGSEVTVLAASPIDEMVAAGTEAGEIHLVNAKSGKSLIKLAAGGRHEAMQSLSFDGAGGRVVGAPAGDEARLWDARAGKVIAELTGHTDDINNLAVSPANGAVATVADDKTLRLWDGATGAEIQQMKFPGNGLEHVAFFDRGRGLLAAASESDVYGWIAEEKEEVEELDAEKVSSLVDDLAAYEFAVRKTASERLVEQGVRVLPLLEKTQSDDPEVIFRLREIRQRIRRAEIGSELQKLHTFDAAVFDLVGNPVTGEWAAVVGRGVNARIVIGTSEGEMLLPESEFQNGHEPESLAFSSDGTTLVAKNGDGTVSVYRR